MTRLIRSGSCQARSRWFSVPHALSDPAPYGERPAWKPERPRFRPFRLLLSWLVAAASLLIAAYIVPGIEVAPYYYWTGSLWGRTLTMHNAQRNLLVLGLTSPEAGSDAASMVDTGIICKGNFEGNEVLGLRLNWLRGPYLQFLRTPDTKTVKNRVHLDLRPYPGDDQAAEVARLRALGATGIDIGQGDVPWTCLADPEGNEFDVLTPR